MSKACATEEKLWDNANAVGDNERRKKKHLQESLHFMQKRLSCFIYFYLISKNIVWVKKAYTTSYRHTGQIQI